MLDTGVHRATLDQPAIPVASALLAPVALLDHKVTMDHKAILVVQVIQVAQALLVVLVT